MNSQDRIKHLIDLREKGSFEEFDMFVTHRTEDFVLGDNRINPLVGAAGVSAVQDSARVVQIEGLKADPTNHLLMHAMTPNVSGVIGSAVAAGILLSFLG